MNNSNQVNKYLDGLSTNEDFVNPVLENQSPSLLVKYTQREKDTKRSPLFHKWIILNCILLLSILTEMDDTRNTTFLYVDKYN
jgi:hypothetical protein